jgi:hypothetical protein
MGSYLSLSYQAIENVLQELDAVVKDESASLPCDVSPRKVEFVARKLMINQQVSLASQVLKNPKADNAQHVPKIVEFDDFGTEETKSCKKTTFETFQENITFP